LLRHLAQYQVAARECTLRMAPRIVVRGSAHDRDQQRHLRKIELRKWLAEVELTREPEAVNGTVSILTEEDLIDVGIHEIGLAEVCIERHRHGGLAQLAREGLARAQEVTAHQLLRERASSLLDLVGAHVDPGGAQHGERIDAMVRVELAVLDRLERKW